MRTLPLLLTLIALPGFSQTMYKCPNAAGVAQYQQMPCTSAGGGEAVEVKVIPSGGGAGISDEAKAYLEEREKARQQASQAPSQSRSGEVEKACWDMKRRIMFLEEREARGIHTWSKHGYEESHYLKQEYQKLCGAY